ncbi:MAG: AMP-binding protein [Actinomycetales bacterium]|nr:AMP-binding protein [Actinomycetales bacterium]
MSAVRLTPIVIAPGPVGAHTAVTALRTALAGGAPIALLPSSAQATPSAGTLVAVGQPVAAATAVVLLTGGSTGQQRAVELSGPALTAAALAVRTALGGPGQWVCALPVVHIAGLMTLVRAIVDGTEPLVAPTTGRFDQAAMTGLVRTLAQAAESGPARVSLVAEQARRLLAAGYAPALRGCDAVLLGGGAIPPALREALTAEGIRVRTTYGMTETCGGIVWDGRALPGYQVRIATPPVGRIEIRGPSLATCYRYPPQTGSSPRRPDAAATRPCAGPDGWWLTPDIGTITDGLLSVLGRADDLVKVDGVLVSPAAVTVLLQQQPGVSDAQAQLDTSDLLRPVIAAEVVGEFDDAALRAAVHARLGAAAVPRRISRVATIERDAMGKAAPVAVP